MSTVDQVRAIAEQLAPNLMPGTARDGDCLTIAPAVTVALREFNVGHVDTVPMIGWADHERGLLAYVHTVTIVAGIDNLPPIVVDLTAQQFGAFLPAVWVDDLPVYAEMLAQGTLVERVTVADWYVGQTLVNLRMGPSRLLVEGGDVSASVASIPPAPGRQDASLSSQSTPPGGSNERTNGGPT
ncbi:hypothetical protein [Micromonospora sp. NPDC049645]|uniref:hypothetical protein n=1 Tax=Micromonospora sp. NPDC049645 TaxID=3155508 RepID=UPI0034388DCF